MQIRWDEKKGIAVVKLTPAEEERVDQMGSHTFVQAHEPPSGLRLRVLPGETLTDEARESVRNGILELP